LIAYSLPQVCAYPSPASPSIPRIATATAAATPRLDLEQPSIFTLSVIRGNPDSTTIEINHPLEHSKVFGLNFVKLKIVFNLI
jgi:hypothetical protein